MSLDSLEARRLGPASLAGRVAGFFLHPVEGEFDAPRSEAPRIAVIGLGPGVGTTTLARALARELVALAADTAMVWSAAEAAESAPAHRASRALARQLVGEAGGAVRASGRIVLASGDDLAALLDAAPCDVPIVMEVAHGEDAAIATSLATSAIVVAGRETEPALARAVSESLAAIGPPPWIVGVGREGAGGCDHSVRWSRSGARVARAGFRAPRRGGRPMEGLARSVAPSLAVRT